MSTKFAKVPITQTMIERALEIGDILEAKRANGNSVLLKKNVENIGALGQVVIRQWLENNFVTFHTDELESLIGGDDTDFEVNSVSRGATLRIDVKTSSSRIDWDNRNDNVNLVLERQLNKLVSKNDYVVFVRIYRSRTTFAGYIMGGIHVRDFLNKGYPVTMKYKNWAIKNEDLLSPDEFLAIIK